MKNVDRLLSLCLVVVTLFLSLCVPARAYGQEEEQKLNLYAQSVVLMDGETGRVLYEKNGDQVRPMASTTKIMTCIIALENGNPKDRVEVSSYAASMPDVQLGIRQGEAYALEDLLYSLMLESHNDSAVAIAEHIGGSVSGFAEMMNQKARDLGCLDTYFITPNGLDATDSQSGLSHTTTARDLALIMRYCISYSPKKEQFLEITRTASKTIFDLDQKRSFYCGNHNALLTTMPEAVSGKTGFTNNAGYCYVGAIEKDGKTFIMALMACGWPPHKSYKWSDMRVLRDYALEQYEYRDIFEKTRVLVPVNVENGTQDQAFIGLMLPPEKQTLPFLVREGEKIRVVYDIPKSVQAPVLAGSGIGSVKYYIQDQQVASFPVYLLETVGKRDLLWSLKQIWAGYAL